MVASPIVFSRRVSTMRPIGRESHLHSYSRSRVCTPVLQYTARQVVSFRDLFSRGENRGSQRGIVCLRSIKLNLLARCPGNFERPCNKFKTIPGMARLAVCSNGYWRFSGKFVTDNDRIFMQSWSLHDCDPTGAAQPNKNRLEWRQRCSRQSRYVNVK